MQRDARKSWLSGLLGGGSLLDDDLSEEEKRYLRQQQMSAMGQGLLEAGGWSERPINMAEAMARGGQYGQGARQQGYQDVMQRRQSVAEQAKAQEQQQAQAAYLQGLTPEQQNLARVMGVGPFAAQQSAHGNKMAEQSAKPQARSNAYKQATDMGLPEGSAEHAAMVRQLSTQSKAPVVNVNTGGYSPFDKALASKDAETYASYRDQAQAAGGAMESIGVLRQINSLRQGGKIGEAVALVGQYFGTEAGANMQTFQAAQSQMVLKAAESLKGAMSDRDIQLLEENMPRFGNDPRANEIIMQILERAAQKQIANFDAADKHVSSTGNMRGFRPIISAPGPRPNVNATSVGDEDFDAIMSQYGH